MEDTASLTLECLLFLEMKGWQAICSLEGSWAWLCPLDGINEMKSEFRPCEQNTRDPTCWLPLASCVSLGKVLSLSGLPIKMILQLRIREPTLVCGSHSGWAQEGTLLYHLLQQRCWWGPCPPLGGLGNLRHMPLGPVYIPAWESGSSLGFRAEGA